MKRIKYNKPFDTIQIYERSLPYLSKDKKPIYNN